jgi:hypothetical protein
VELVYVIDGMDAIDACYHFAGIVGLNPHEFTLRELWKMACGKIKQRRFEMFELSRLVWCPEDLDVSRYLLFGLMQSTGVGEPIEQKCDELDLLGGEQ